MKYRARSIAAVCGSSLPGHFSSNAPIQPPAQGSGPASTVAPNLDGVDRAMQDTLSPEAPAATSPTPAASAEGASVPVSMEGNPNVQGVEPSPPQATPEGGMPAVPEMPAPVTPPASPSFILGADLSSVQEAVAGGAVFVDTDGVQKSLIALL